jgi:hypothetical protein
MLFVLFVSIGMSWFAVRLRYAENQRQAIAMIQRLGGSVYYDHTVDDVGNFLPFAPSRGPRPTTLRRLLGNDFFDRAVCFYSRSKMNDVALEWCRNLPYLRRVNVDFSEVTDAGLKHLAGNIRLASLEVAGTRVGDGGLEHLTHLRNLRRLDLSATKVSDAGLKHLRGIVGLQELSLAETDVGDQGIMQLRGMSELRSLTLDGTRISDATLKTIAELPQLEELRVQGTAITDAGLAHLRKLSQLRLLDLRYSLVTDAGMRRLTTLPALEKLYLANTTITASAVQHYRMQVPHVKIDQEADIDSTSYARDSRQTLGRENATGPVK